MNVAQLTIEMAANVARLKTDMAAARNTVDSTMNSIRKSASLAAGALGAIGVGLSVSAFAGWIKSAINAADETNKLAQKIGIAVQEIGGLQLAFQQGGVNAEAMQKSLAKLNVNIANGEASFRALGVSTKNIDGSFRSTTEVLIDIADKFANTQDGAAKTAMAMEIFGKSGVDLIPVLNAGGQSIKEFGDLAQKLGLVLSSDTAAAAEKFNDTLELISLGGRGVANQLMAELLPTLQSLAGEFLTLITTGDNLKDVAWFISTALKGLFTVAAGGVEIMRSLLIMTDAAAKAFMALGSGDFKGIDKIFKETEKTLKENWMATLGSFDRLWNQTGNTAIEAASKIVKGTVQSTKAMEDAEKAAKKLAEEQEKALKSAADLLNSITFETETLQMSNVEKEVAINLRKLEATGLDQNTALYKAYAEAIRSTTIENEGIKERIKLEEEGAKKAKKIAEDYAREMDQINNQIGQSLTDALVNGGKSAKEFLIDMFRTLILRPILQPIITGGTGAVMAALGLGGSGNAMASAGGSAGAFNIMSSVKSAYDMVSGGFMALGTQAALAAESMGSWLVMNTTGQLNSFGGTLMANSGSIGSFTSGAAGIGAGIMAGEFISGGKSVIGGNSLYTTGGGAAAGAALGTFVFPGVGTAIGGLVGGIVGGVVNAAFGSGAKNVTGQSIQGTLTTQGLMDARSATSWSKKGGWFGGGGSGKDLQAISAGLQTFMDDALISVTNAARGYADTLGISTEALADATHYFEIPANSAEEATKYLEGELKGFANQLAQTLLVNTNYARENETAIDTLARLATSIKTVNNTFDALGFKLYETSLAGADAASALVEMMGGLDSFNKSMDFYYQNFYSQEERTAKATENLTKVFASMNLELPNSVQQFRAMIDAIQAGGDKVLLANLLKLAPAFLEVSNAVGMTVDQILQQRTTLINQLNQLQGNNTTLRQQELDGLDASNRGLQEMIYAIQDAQVASDTARKNVEAALQKEQARIQSSLNQAQSSLQQSHTAALQNLRNQFDATASNLEAQKADLLSVKNISDQAAKSMRSVFDFLKGEIDSILGTLGFRSFAPQEGMLFIDEALATLRSGGALPNEQILREAISAAREGLTVDAFGSSFEYQKANLRLVANLQELQKIANEQMVIAEQQSSALEPDLRTIERMLDEAESNYNLSVSMADQQFNDSMSAAQQQHSEQLNAAQAQVDALYKVDESVLNLADAIAAAIAAELALREARTAPIPNIQDVANTINDVRSQGITAIYEDLLDRLPDASGLQYFYNSMYNLETIADQIEASAEYRGIEINKMYQDILNRSADVSGLSFWASSTATLEEIRRSISESAEARSIRGFASGGYYGGGMAMVGEEGPELINFDSPGMVYNANQTRSMMAGGDDVAFEIRGLREENKEQSRALVNLQNRMTRLLERWDGDGLPEERSVA